MRIGAAVVTGASNSIAPSGEKSLGTPTSGSQTLGERLGDGVGDLRRRFLRLRLRLSGDGERTCLRPLSDRVASVAATSDARSHFFFAS